MKIAGSGWVTPLGSDVRQVWDELLAGKEAAAVEITDHDGNRPYKVFRVAEETLRALPQHPRLRRASAISRFAAAAGLSALSAARATIDKIDMARTALIFAVSNGGVIYTKRFYHDIIASGAGAASPLLFPETVFNAPASHLAAILEIDGASYTLVGDGAVGALALGMAEDLLGTNQCDHCLVVAAEEADWLLADAYRKWRLLKKSPPVEPYRAPARGMIPSEGAGAVFLSCDGAISIDCVDGGGHFTRRDRVAIEIEGVLKRVATPRSELVIGSANGTFLDEAERGAIAKYVPGAVCYAPKIALGDSIGASALWQVIIGATALETGKVPPLRHVANGTGIRLSGGEVGKFREAVVLACGLNQQVAGMRLSK